MTIGLTELQAAVTQEIFPTVADGLTYSTALWNHLTTRGKEKVDGGLYYQFGVKALVNQSQSAISGESGVTDSTPSQQMIYGVLYRKYNYFAVNLTLQDFTVASGDNQKIKFAVTKAQGAKADFYRSLSVQSWASSTTNALNLDGMLDILAASGTSYAGILNTTYDPTVYSAQNIKNVYSPLYYTDTILSYKVLSKMTTGLAARMQQNAEDQNQELLGWCNSGVFTEIQNVCQASQLLGSTAKAELGFKGFRLNNMCDVYLDVNCPGSMDGSTADNYLVMHAAEDLKLYYDYGLGEKSPIDGEMNIPGTVINTNRYFLAGNMVSPNRRGFVYVKLKV